MVSCFESFESSGVDGYRSACDFRFFVHFERRSGQGCPSYGCDIIFPYYDIMIRTLLLVKSKYSFGCVNILSKVWATGKPDAPAMGGLLRIPETEFCKTKLGFSALPMNQTWDKEVVAKRLQI